MKIIRIEAVWCSSCLIMKSRMQELTKEKEIEWISVDYDNAKELLEQYQIIDDILPIYIREDNGSVLIGEKSKKEILEFLKES